MTAGTRAVSLNNAVALPTLAIGVFRFMDLTATEAARAVQATGDRSVEPRRSACRAYSSTKSRIDGLTPAGQATALVYATEACEYEREIRPRVSDLSPVTAANSARLWGSFDPAGNHPEATERTA